MRENNFAYIDGANLYNGIKSSNWELHYQRFRVWLLEKYSIQTAYLFLGLISEYKDLYTRLQKDGFILVFKDVIYDDNGKPKGNCDADLVLHVVRDFYERKFDRAVIVSSDGDYASLVKFLQESKRILSILSPYQAEKCSILLKRTGVSISYLSEQKYILSKNKKAPDRDETL